MAAVGLARVGDTAAAVDERVQQFQRDGYVVSRGMFSADEMRDFIAECQSFEGKATDRVEPNSRGAMQFYSELFRKSALIRRFITQPSLLDFLTPITGPDLWVRWDQAVAKGRRLGCVCLAHRCGLRPAAAAAFRDLDRAE